MAPRTLHDFYVTLAANGAGYTSFVQRSPAGQGQGPFTPPVQRSELEPLRREFSITIPASGRPRDLRTASKCHSLYQPEDIGERLGKGLFTGEVELLHVGSLGALQSSTQDEGLRFSIHLNLRESEIAWLGQLPWELIRHRHRYLLRNPKYSLARCLDLPGRSSPAIVKETLNVLVVMACPEGVQELAMKSEYRALKKSFRNSPSVKVELLEDATPVALGQRVREEAFHVVHFVGHAGFDSEGGRGHLLLKTDSGAPNPVEAGELADLLRGKVTPQLLVLNACETASFSWQGDHDPWSGLATALLLAEFPAVVSMQFPITDQAAVAFSRGFYGLLAAGCPADIAITGGRQAIFLANHSSLEWATPVLFLRGMEGNIFTVEMHPPKQQTVLIKVQSERPDTPYYGDTLVNDLATYLEIAPADVKRIDDEDGRGPLTVKLPAAAAKRLLKAARSAEEEFERRCIALYISYIERPLSPWSSAAITLGLGILGNLLAAWIQEDLLWDFFTLPRVASLIVISTIFSYWRLFARLRRWLRVGQVIATLLASVVLVAGFAVPAALLPDGDCDQISRVELDLPMAHLSELSLSGNHVTDISAQDLQGIQRLSGRAVLANPGSSCICEWSGKTDQEEKLTSLGPSANCSFTIDLPPQYSRIHLLLKVGEQSDLFVIRVQ